MSKTAPPWPSPAQPSPAQPSRALCVHPIQHGLGWTTYNYRAAGCASAACVCASSVQPCVAFAQVMSLKREITEMGQAQLAFQSPGAAAAPNGGGGQAGSWLNPFSGIFGGGQAKRAADGPGSLGAQSPDWSRSPQIAPPDFPK